MGDYFLGTKVRNVVLGNPTDPTLEDKADGQIAGMLGPTEAALIQVAISPGGTWTYDDGTVEWTSSAGGSDDLIFPLAFRSGTIIKEIHLAIEVATNGAGGDLKLMRRHRTPVAGSMPGVNTVATIDADIWNGLSDGDATAMDYAGLTYVLAAEYSYWLYLTARAGVVCKAHEANVVIHRAS